MDLIIGIIFFQCSSLRKQCDELTMQKQAVEIKSDMLLAENRRAIEEKDVRFSREGYRRLILRLFQNEIKRLRESTSTVSWNNVNDLNNTWTDILEGLIRIEISISVYPIRL